MFICVWVCRGGVVWGGGGRSHFLRHQFSTAKREGERESEGDKGREKKEKAECFGVTILLLIALAVSVLQNMTLPSLSHDRNTGDWINTILCSD